MDKDKSKDVVSISSPQPSPIEDNGIQLTSTAPFISTSVPVKVCPYLLYRQYAKDIYILATSNDIDGSPVRDINIPSTNADFSTVMNSMVKSIRMLYATSSHSLTPLRQSYHLLHQ